jgi:hypothetical protein
MLYPAYAVVPRFLDLHWQAFGPLLHTRQFFRMGERLGAEAYTRAQSYFDIPDLRSIRLHDHAAHDGNCGLAGTLEYYQYLDPLLLLITVAQMQAFDGNVGCPQGETEPANPKGFVNIPALAPIEGAGLPLSRIWEERRRALGLAFVPEEHRAMAMWPEFYQRYWTALKDLMASPLYADCQFRIGESAWELAAELPVQIETEIPRLLEAGITDDEIRLLARINESLIGSLTGLLLDVTFLRIACEGGSRAQPSGEKSKSSKTPEPAGSRAA